MIDWSKTIIVFDEDTVDAICGKEILWTRTNEGGGGGGAAIWGFIRGDLDDQTDLMNALEARPTDVPEDGHFYVRKDGAWEDLYFVKEEGLTLYVDGANGDDENDGLTSATAFATIQKAIESVPYDWTESTINIAAGSYENIQDHPFSVSNKNIQFSLSGNVTYDGSISIINGSNVTFSASSKTLTITGNVAVRSGSYLEFGSGISTLSIGNGGSEANVDVVSSRFVSNTAITTSTDPNYLVRAFDASFVSFSTQKTGFALYADDGSIMGYGGNKADSETTYRGSRIYYGAQEDFHINDPVTVYVDPTNGSDSNDGTQSYPFKTLQKAIDTVPKGTKQYSVIHMTAGTYATSGTSVPFMTDDQCINFSASGAVVISSKVLIEDFSDIKFSGGSGTSFTINNTVEANTFSTVYSDVVISIDGSGGSGTALSLKSGARFIHESTTKTIELSGLYGVKAETASTAYFYALTTSLGTGFSGGCGISATNGAVVSYGTHTTTFTTAKSTASGGRILEGTQPVLGTMASTDDAPYDSKSYGRKNGNWVEVTGGGVAGGATYYVDASSGSDTNDGSQSTPFATITKAISEVDSGGGLEISTINVAAGTYSGGFTISDKAIKLNINGAVSVSGVITISDHAFVEIEGGLNKSLTSSRQLLIQSGSLVLCNCTLTINTTTDSEGIRIEDSHFINSNMTYTTTVTVSDQYGSGVYAIRSYAYFYTLSATVTTAISSLHGSIVAYYSLTGTHTNNSSTDFGGRVYSGTGGAVDWGQIGGTLANQTDLQTALNAKLSDAPSNSNEYVRKGGAWVVASSSPSAVTLYVNRSTGSDSNDGTSSSAPLKSIKKAIELVPSAVNASSSIHVYGGGTHSETIDINNKNIYINFNADTTISGAIYIYNSRIGLYGNSKTLTLSNSFSASLSNVDINITISQTYSTATSAFTVYGNSAVNAYCVLTITNGNNGSSATGLSVNRNSSMYVHELVITSKVGIECETGGYVTYNTLSGTMTTQTKTASGGRIYTGAQS